MNAVAIIPARGGSKRLPRKNVANFFGRPIIAYTIAAALETRLFDRVVVSTEDPDIAAAADSAGADVDRRPEELATDQARVVDVCLEFLAREEAAQRRYDEMCCLYATAPLRSADDIAAVMELLRQNECDFAMAVTTFAVPPHQALKRMEDGHLKPMWPDVVTARTDELPPLVIDNGSTYAVSVEAFRATRSFYGVGLRGHLMERKRSVDIDTADDLDLARWYWERLRSQ